MYLYVELWKVKDAWVELTEDERKEKLGELMAEAKKNPITGVIPVSVREIGDIVMFDGVKETPAIVSDDVARPTGFRYIAAYMIPTVELILKFEKRVENLGWWFEYFEQQNAWGEMGIEAAVADMIAAGGADLGDCGSSKPGKQKSKKQKSKKEKTKKGAADNGGYVARFEKLECKVAGLTDDMKELLSIMKKRG